MIQEITVIIILVVVVVFVGYKGYYLLFPGRKSPCGDCTGCALKEELKGAKFDCHDRKVVRKTH
ncbi:MAG: FeoB-associated Cys-rich membrane protein [Tannerella sp.]|jgi:hypothetical protein|nr:FeoB-associated Cys-rich membrane protein [Tannerella sp.]